MNVKLSRIFAGSIHCRVFKIQDLGYSQGGNMATLETGKTLAGCKPQHTRNIQSWYHFAGEKIQLWCSGAASLNTPLMWQRGSDQPRSLVGKIKTTRSTKQLQKMKEPNSTPTSMGAFVAPNLDTLGGPPSITRVGEGMSDSRTNSNSRAFVADVF